MTARPITAAALAVLVLLSQAGAAQAPTGRWLLPQERLPEVVIPKLAWPSDQQVQAAAALREIYLLRSLQDQRAAWDRPIIIPIPDGKVYINPRNHAEQWLIPDAVK